MSNASTFFSESDIKDGLKALSTELAAMPKGAAERYKAHHLNTAVSIFVSHDTLADKSCQANISWIGHSLRTLLDNRGRTESRPTLDEFYALFFRLVIELDLSMREDLSHELAAFLRYPEEHPEAFGEHALGHFSYARQQMPIAVLKKLLHQDEISSFLDLPKYSKEISDRVAGWSATLASHEDTVEHLEQSLKSYETAFNFVGLFDGFRDLADTTAAELKRLRRLLVFFGVLVLLPIASEATYVLAARPDFAALPIYFPIALSVSALSLTLIFIYFFRITLRSTDAAKSQLLQLELRKTLCRFIQSYAEYSQGLKDKGADLLSKFENVIFSGIVSSDEKLPSTFDGIDQVSRMIKALKGSN